MGAVSVWPHSSFPVPILALLQLLGIVVIAVVATAQTRAHVDVPAFGAYQLPFCLLPVFLVILSHSAAGGGVVAVAV